MSKFTLLTAGSQPDDTLLHAEIGALPAPYRKPASLDEGKPAALAAQALEGQSESLSDPAHYLDYCDNDFTDAESTVGASHEYDTESSAHVSATRIRGSRRTPVRKNVTRAEDIAAHEAMHHATLIGRALNFMLTLNLVHIRDAAPEDRPALWKKVRDALRVWFNKRGEVLTWIWNRASVDREFNGEHLHALLHVPAGLTKKFRDFLDASFGWPAYHLRAAWPQAWLKDNGSRQYGLNYILQGIHPMRAKGLNRSYKYGGWVMGKRVGMSDDIAPKAVKAFRFAHGMSEA